VQKWPRGPRRLSCRKCSGCGQNEARAFPSLPATGPEITPKATGSAGEGQLPRDVLAGTPSATIVTIRTPYTIRTMMLFHVVKAERSSKDNIIGAAILMPHKVDSMEISFKLFMGHYTSLNNPNGNVNPTD